MSPVSAPAPFHQQSARPLPSLQWWVAGLTASAALIVLAWAAVTRWQSVPDQKKLEAVASASEATPPPPAAQQAPQLATIKPKAVALPQPVTFKDEPLAPVSGATEDSAFNNVKLQGIIYSTGHPSAILNGKAAEVSQHVADCLIVEITPNSVTLEHQDHRKTLTLK
jgi:hypothetical protein